ncbi:MAG: acyl-CoA desaturase [Planctomycetota bacterium]|jgi:stearoyl-CoA desaturase (delta-9 desaturase)
MAPTDRYDPGRLPLLHRIANLLAILLPFAGLIVAIVFVWGWGFHLIDLVLLFVMYLATGLGVTIGFHRLFTHRSFETGRTMRSILAILGSMAVEGPLLQWVATHRCHHQHSDRDDDPHSPHHHGGGLWNMLRGLWRAHIGWFFDPFDKRLKRYVADYRDDRLVKALSALFPAWVLLGLLIPGVIAGLLTWSWTGAALGVLWGGLVRIFVVHHVTWSVNSVCHIWGTRPFRSHDQSRNNAIFGVLAFGEGWHNNHHAFPTSARHGLRWWEFDLSYLIIRLMSMLRLAHAIRVPSRNRIAAKIRSTP